MVKEVHMTDPDDGWGPKNPNQVVWYIAVLVAILLAIEWQEVGEVLSTMFR